MPHRRWRIALDRGGTFTDIVAERGDGHVVTAKVPTELDTKDAGSAAHGAVIDTVRRIVGAPVGEVINGTYVSAVRCGTTAATNALLERRGDRAALLVTRGFRDLLVIGTQERLDLFSLDARRPAPLYDVVIEIDERVGADGAILRALSDDEVRAAAASLRALGIASVAVLFLHSFAFPEHERRAAVLLRDAGIETVVPSHGAAAEMGAVARGQTAVADAYLTPVLRRSLARIRAAFASDVDVRFMTSHGGLTDVSHARGGTALLSGPAGGALAVARVIARAGASQGIGFDMGGTSTDVCRVGPSPEASYETRIGLLRLRVPTLRVHTVAAGGGSLLTFDGRRFHVGPQSGGASPGPAGYGLGGAATLTDADAVLGRLVASSFPACFGVDGQSAFDLSASRRSLEAMATAAGMSVEQAAAGFVRIADEHVAQAIREESVLRGHDVRTHPLVAFGGAGPQHACAVAQALESPYVLLSRRASVLSAWGIAGAGAAHEGVRAVLRSLDDDALRWARGVASELSEISTAALRAQQATPPGAAIDVTTLVELRVRGVDATIAVPLSSLAETSTAFADAHKRLYGFLPLSDGVEIVNVRVRVAVLPSVGAAPETSATATKRAPSDQSVSPVTPVSPVGRSAVLWCEGADGLLSPAITPLVALSLVIGAGKVTGPALVVGPLTTIVVLPGWCLEALDDDLLKLTRVGHVERPRVGTDCDAVSLALFANTFMSIAERMGAVLERVSHSTNIKERLDFSCALFDSEGRLVANAPHVPVHLGAMGESVRAIAAARGDDFRDGDAFLTNDPYRGGSHLPDITVVTPLCVADGRPAFFVANRAHHADVGGRSPGSMPPLSTSIDEEGVCLHDFLLVRDGQFRDEAVRAAFANHRYPARAPDQRVADLTAQCAANAEGARLLTELCERVGADVVAAYMQHIQDDGDQAMREVLRTFPPGVRSREEHLDDGTRLAVTITLEGGGAIIDFAGTGPRGATNLHAPRAVVRAAVLYAFRTLIARPVPLNEGCLRSLDIRIPDGSLLQPQFPDAVVGGNVETSQRIVDLILTALDAAAASQGTMNNVTFGNADGAYYETLAGGMGALPCADGASGIQCHMTNTRITDIEVLERRFPVLVRRFSLRPNSGGRGAHNGGDGLVREIEFLAEMEGGVLSERRTSGAPGILGGGTGAPGRNTLIRKDGTELRLPGRQSFHAEIGDVLRIETPGGGGAGAR